MFCFEHKALCVRQRTKMRYVYCIYIKTMQIKCIINKLCFSVLVTFGVLVYL